MPRRQRKPSASDSKLRTFAFWGLVIGGFIGLPTLAVVYNYWRIAIHADNYSRAVFVVTLVGVDTNTGGKNSTKHRWAEGTIDGIEERIGLGGFGAEATTTEDLQIELPPGTELNVWHDPTAADVTTQSSTLDVIPGSTNLKAVWPKAIGMTILCHGIFIVGLICYLRCRVRGLRVFSD